MIHLSDLNKALQDAAAILDIPDYLAEEAIAKYEAIGTWLCEEESDLRQYSPEIYPQGSFRLGTVIHPLLEDDEFDIDLVCRLAIRKEQTTQEELKNRVGKRLRQDGAIAEILASTRRCWRLNYPGKFHLDVLPAIPDVEGTPESILLTDTDLTRWQHSNPIGYADWFFSRMGTVFLEEREGLAKAAGVEVEEIHLWRVRTPLQRAVQLLKRHRDLYFRANNKNRPVSIIITTLAAQAYNEERDVYAALLHAAQNMPRYVENRNGRWWVANPAHPEENFADKWNEGPDRKDAFITWLTVVERDLDGFAKAGNADQVIEKMTGLRAAGVPRVRTAQIPALADARHQEVPSWPERLTYKCQVRGWVYPGVRRGKKLWQIRDQSVLPKKVGLRFDASTNAPQPHEVRWQVVNTGREAGEAAQLRGGFESSEQGKQGFRWESTLYAGTHWIEAFVMKDGVCVARSGRRYVRIHS